MAMLETLESRVLMSASAAQIAIEVHTVKANEHALQLGVNFITKTLTKDQKLIAGDLSKLGVTAADATLTANLVAADSALISNQTTTAKSYDAELTKEMTAYVSEGKQLQKHPTDANLQGEVKTDDVLFGYISQYGNAPFTYYSKVPAIYPTMDAIAAANPTSNKLAGDIKSIETGAKAAVAKAQTKAGKLFDADIGNLELLFYKLVY